MQPSVSGKYKFIGCEILYREACYLAATGPHRVDVQFLPKGLHDLPTPEMVARIQQTIDAVDPSAGFEAILLGYGRCNNGLVGITTRDIPLVLPRAHDCITFFLGSRQAYRCEFDAHPGTYYMTTGWTERNASSEEPLARPAYDTEGVMGRLGLTEPYEQLVAKYGQDNADYIIETLGDWTQNYSRLCYLEMSLCDETAFIEQAHQLARERNWQFQKQAGNWNLLKKLFAGPWDEDFLVVQPHEQIVERNDEEILDVSS